MPSCHPPRRLIIAVIGDADCRQEEAGYQFALALGRRLVDAGYRVCSGGLGGVMTAVFIGARQSIAYCDGDTIAILPSLNHRDANPHADIVIPSGMGHLRNGLVAAADAVIAVGGQAGTLSEMAFAWRYSRLLIGTTAAAGVAAQYAGKAMDKRKDRHRPPILKTVVRADTAEEAVAILNANLPGCYVAPESFGI